MRPVRALAAVALVTALAAGACGSDGGADPDAGSGGGADPVAHQAAAGVCRILVAFDRTVAVEVNDASHQITADTDPDRTRALLLEATDDVRAATRFLPQRYAALSIRDDGDAGRLVADASEATAAVEEQLDAIQAELTSGLDDEDSRAILSAVFIDMEKVQSLAQPDQGDYADPALVDQLDTLADCEHTISR